MIDTFARRMSAASLAMFALVFAGSAEAWSRVVAPPANAPSPKTARVTTAAPKPLDYVLGTPIKGTSFGVVGARGSLGLGLLLGPVGVAANVAKVNEENTDRARPLAGLYQTDLVGILKTVRQETPSDDMTATPGYDLLPMAQLRFDDATRFHIGCMVRASLTPAGSKKPSWSARYLVEMPGTFDSQSPDAASAAQAVLTPCLSEANRLFEQHVTGGMLPGATRRPVAMYGKMVPANIVETEAPDHIIVPDAAGMIEYPAS